jgi:hypothetical protein
MPPIRLEEQHSETVGLGDETSRERPRVLTAESRVQVLVEGPTIQECHLALETCKSSLRLGSL